MSVIRRVFLGWDEPLLHQTVDQLAQDSGIKDLGKNAADGARGKPWDLRNWTLVLPVVRAVERLGQLLSAEAAVREMKLQRPRLITVGRLPELLYQPKLPLAGDMQQTLAWTRALMSMDQQQLEPLMPVAPPREPVAPWIEMAGVLRRLCEDLAADGMSPQDVVKEVETESERRRWQTIHVLFSEYLRQLAKAELADPFQQRRLATESGICRARGPIVLIGCVDIGSSTCKMLETIAKDVSIYIGAPENQQHLFDACGRVSPGRWNDFHVEIDEQELIPTGDANAQAAAAAEILGTWRAAGGSGAAGSLTTATVGITDPLFGPIIETELSLCGFKTHRLGATVISRTAPGRMLQRISDFLQAKSWNSFAALIRHTDILQHFAAEFGTSTILTRLDELRADHFPIFINDPLPVAVEKDAQSAELRQVTKRVLDWLLPLERHPMALARWCQPLKEVLKEIYGGSEESETKGSEVDSQAKPQAAPGDIQPLVMHDIYQLLDHLSELPEALDLNVPGSVAVEMVLQRLSEPRSLGEVEDVDVEIAGWLDLTLDDACEMIVIGLNHPFVPQAVTSDAFLPGSLRARLSVADNERRFARDLYVLQMIHSTREHRAFIVGRAGPDGSPTPPSRLLAACPSGVTLKRVRKLLGGAPLEPRPITRWDRNSEKSDLPIPIASRTVIPNEISVTAFRAYLECPYRFYLRHVLNLRPLDDAAAELAANQFGDLVHAAVERFGLSGDKDLTDPGAIEESVLHHLRAYAEEMYGPSPMAAVRLQVTQAEKRLKVFAERQAERIADGWQIKKAEAAVRGKDGAVINCVDGRSLKLKGRIDRIDYHPATGRWAILDYKTHGHEPLGKHFDKRTNSWIDLQLPLYLLMLKALKIEAAFEQVQVGYFNIADRAADSGIHLLELSDDFRESAFDAARRAAERILDGDFSPQLDASLIPYDDYSMILQTGAAENLLVGDFETEGE